MLELYTKVNTDCIVEFVLTINLLFFLANVLTIVLIFFSNRNMNSTIEYLWHTFYSEGELQCQYEWAVGQKFYRNRTCSSETVQTNASSDIPTGYTHIIIDSVQNTPAAMLPMLINFDAHCCHTMGTAIKHPVPNLAKPSSFVIFDIRALRR